MQNNNTTAKPDIYLFILDGHARQDYLKDKFGYTNNDFINELQQRGFYVSPNATSNYAQTELSLSSELNMEYQNEIFNLSGLENGSKRIPLLTKIEHNTSTQALQKKGYTVISFRSVTGISLSSDIVIGSSSNVSFDRFITTYINLAPINIYNKGKGMLDASYPKTLISPFTSIKEVFDVSKPKFVFAHVLAPHPPFVFDAKGNINLENLQNIEPGADADTYAGNKSTYIKEYTAQMEFIDKLMLNTVDQILAASETPPIIIIHSDHGSGLDTNMENIDKTDLGQRFAILYAIKTPNPVNIEKYENITPVNSLRLIMNDYLGENLELLENKNYFSTWARPYKFIEVTEKVNKK
jgi:hypothetical protein